MAKGDSKKNGIEHLVSNINLNLHNLPMAVILSTGCISVIYETIQNGVTLDSPYDVINIGLAALGSIYGSYKTVKSYKGIKKDLGNITEQYRKEIS